MRKNQTKNPDVELNELLSQHGLCLSEELKKPILGDLQFAQKEQIPSGNIHCLFSLTLHEGAEVTGTGPFDKFYELEFFVNGTSVVTRRVHPAKGPFTDPRTPEPLLLNSLLRTGDNEFRVSGQVVGLKNRPPITTGLLVLTADGFVIAPRHEYLPQSEGPAGMGVFKNPIDDRFNFRYRV